MLGEGDGAVCRDEVLSFGSSPQTLSFYVCFSLTKESQRLKLICWNDSRTTYIAQCIFLFLGTKMEAENELVRELTRHIKTD